MAILLNIKENSIKLNIIIKVKIQNQQQLGNSWEKKEVKKIENGKKMFFIDKVIK